MKITDVKVECPECGGKGNVGQCECDGDHPHLVDEGRLRCPECVGLVRQEAIK